MCDTSSPIIIEGVVSDIPDDLISKYCNHLRGITLDGQLVDDMESDDAKYVVLLEQLDKTLESAIAPLESAFGKTEDVELKNYVAELLKNVYFRFRDKNEEYKANYEKYNSFLQK